MGSRRSFLLSGLALGVASASDAGPVPQSSEEASAGVVPLTAGFPSRDVRRYGAVLDGTSDDTAALRAWARVGGALTFPAATARITASIPLSSGTSITAAAGAAIVLTVPDASFLTASGQSSIAIRGLRFRQAQGGAKAYVAGVLLDRCSRCLIEGNEFEGLQWAGVQLLNSADCVIRGNRFHDWQGDVPDAADVCVYQSSSGNVIDGNELNGGGCHGILCQDPYAGLVPSNNTFSNNRVGRHTAYGIAVYCPGPGGTGNSNNAILSNEIRDIEGSYHRNPASGAGIYVVGAWAGGTQVKGNRISNCCGRTTERTLAPAAIGINGIAAGATPPVVADNEVLDMSQGDGLLVVSSPGGCSITGGSIELPPSNAARGPGGAALLGCGVRVENSSHVHIRAIRVYGNGLGSALFVYAHELIASDISVEAAEFSSSGGAAAVRVDGVGKGRVSALVMEGGGATATGDAPAVHIGGVAGGRISNLTARSRSQPALDLANSSNLRISGGSYAASASVSVRIAGDCTGSVLEKSMTRSGARGGLDIRGQGVRVE